MVTKPLQPDAEIVKSLLALKKELEMIYLGRSGEGAIITMKINTCLYGKYPVGRS
jgi:hypothetical protein